MASLYPTSLANLDQWRQETGVTLDEARKRFIQFAVLESIGTGSRLRNALAFKGGNALRFIYGNPRSTLDLDFTVDGPEFPDDEAQVRALLDQGLVQESRRIGVKMKCQRVKRNPKRKDATLPTFQVTVGYQFPGERLFADFENPARTASTVVDIEMSLNDLVCETKDQPLPPGSANIRVCALEDILAEKLRALLQQPIRDRTRPQDVFDLARVLRDRGDSLDYGKIAAYLIRKSEARQIQARKSAFAEPEIKQRASTDYANLSQETTAAIIPFDEAWQEVMGLVSRLEIPE